MCVIAPTARAATRRDADVARRGSQRTRETGEEARHGAHEGELRLRDSLVGALVVAVIGATFYQQYLPKAWADNGPKPMEVAKKKGLFKVSPEHRQQAIAWALVDEVERKLDIPLNTYALAGTQRNAAGEMFCTLQATRDYKCFFKRRLESNPHMSPTQIKNADFKTRAMWTTLDP